MLIAASFILGLVAGAPPAADSIVAIPMRDGVMLRGTLLLPQGSGPFPTLIYRTPYGQGSALESYSTFSAAVRRGYAVLAQDVRGRYLSDGTFDPYRQEGKDGYDTIEWAAAQPWSTGSVGTFGLSYPGAVQWLAAIEVPPHLAAMVPAMTFSRPTNFWYAGGVADLSWPAWIWLNIAPDANRRLGTAGPTTYQGAAAVWDTLARSIAYRMPITDVPELDQIAPWFKRWYAHPADDPWWDWADLTNKYPRTRAAVLNVSGWHDDNYGPEGAITNHRGLVAARADAVDPRSELLIGPWVHGVAGMNDRTAQAKSGERVFGAAAGIDYDAEILNFMDRYVAKREAPRPPRVRVFVMGENRWRAGETWPLPGTTTLRLHLSGHRLTEQLPRQAARRTITANPARPIEDPFANRSGAHDYRRLTRRGDVLVYETAPLPRDLRVVGNIHADLTVSTSAPSVDVWVKVLDVAPDGTAWNVMSAGLDVIRLPAAAPNTPRLAQLRDMVTGNLFKRGHRLRVVVMNSFMPNFGRNPQTGLSETQTSTVKPATFSVRTGPRSPSFLTLPILADLP